jgi:hypothetical protein
MHVEVAGNTPRRVDPLRQPQPALFDRDQRNACPFVIGLERDRNAVPANRPHIARIGQGQAVEGCQSAIVLKADQRQPFAHSPEGAIRFRIAADDESCAAESWHHL